MNQYAGHQSDAVIPTEMKRLLRALSDDKSVQIVAELLRNGKMRFGEIKDAFGLSSSSLSSKLKKLQNGGLVVNFYAKGSDLGHSYYDATEMSELVFDSLFNILYAPNAPRREYDAATIYQNIYHFTEGAGVQGAPPDMESATTRIGRRDAQDTWISMDPLWRRGAGAYDNQRLDGQRVDLES